MGLAELLDRIGEKSKAEIAQVKEQALGKTHKIMSEGEEEAKRIRKEGKEGSLREAQSVQEKMLQNAHLEARREVLKEKTDALESVFGAALENLENLPAEEFLPWTRNLVLENIEEGKAEIILAERDRSKIKADFLKEMNQQLKGKSELKLSSESRDIGGGFVLKQGRKEVNCSFQAILEDKKDALRLKLNELLFR